MELNRKSASQAKFGKQTRPEWEKQRAGSNGIIVIRRIVSKWVFNENEHSRHYSWCTLITILNIGLKCKLTFVTQWEEIVSSQRELCVRGWITHTHVFFSSESSRGKLVTSSIARTRSNAASSANKKSSQVYLPTYRMYFFCFLISISYKYSPPTTAVDWNMNHNKMCATSATAARLLQRAKSEHRVAPSVHISLFTTTAKSGFHCVRYSVSWSWYARTTRATIIYKSTVSPTGGKLTGRAVCWLFQNCCYLIIKGRVLVVQRLSHIVASDSKSSVKSPSNNSD